MKRAKKKFFRKISFILSIILTGSLIPQIDIINTVKAEDPGSSPSIKAFATPDQLMDPNYFNLAGDESKLGKIAFGHDSSGTNSIIWYIAGKDNGNSKDNIVLFSSKPIRDDIEFENDSFDKNILDFNDYGIYENSQSITSVYSSHYGTSNIRALLKEIENNSSLFSEEEKSFILPTTFKNYDIKNHTDYTLTDKLYLASGKFTESEIQNQIYVGSDDSLQIAHAFYENNSSF